MEHTYYGRNGCQIKAIYQSAGACNWLISDDSQLLLILMSDIKSKCTNHMNLTLADQLRITSAQYFTCPIYQE